MGVVQLIRPAQLEDRNGVHALVERAFLASDRPGEIDPDVLGRTITAAMTLPQYCLLVSDNGGIKGAVCGLISPSVYGRFMTATDLFWYAEDGSGFSLYKNFVAWAESFDLVKQINFMNSFKIQAEDTRMDTLMNRLGFHTTGRHYTRARS